MLKFLYKMQKYEYRKIRVNGKAFRAIIADSFVKRMIGLMFRKNLPKDACMLFVFPSESREGIWMRNMQFPIDVVWVGNDLKVNDVAENLAPCKSFFGCKTHYPREESMYILEFNAGTASRLRLKPGNKISM